MKVLHVISGIDPKSGGPTRSVKGICRALDRVGVDVTLLVLRGKHPFDDAGGVEVVYGQKVNVKRFNLVHLQGLWDPALHWIAVECRKCHVPYMISPRGMLDPWALSVKRWKKTIAMWLYQRYDLKKADAFHVTAQDEEAHVRMQNLTQYCIVAPNGVTLPRMMPEKTWGAMGRKTAIFLSRIHPGKGLLLLAEAWAQVRPYGWTMKIVGPDSYGHKAEVVKKLHTLGIVHEWQFVNELEDNEKWSAYRTADLLVHPSVSENFSVTIAEGLAAGLPVIATKGTPWGDLVDFRCGWWIDQGRDALAVALSIATKLPDHERVAMGQRGIELVKNKYMWEAVVTKIKYGYEQVLQSRKVGRCQL